MKKRKRKTHHTYKPTQDNEMQKLPKISRWKNKQITAAT